MDKAQLAENLGTIARSGTSEFLEKLEKGESSSFIGQFGAFCCSIYPTSAPSPPTSLPRLASPRPPYSPVSNLPLTLLFSPGLGFYSSFLVADRVTVASKTADSDEQYIFEANADAESFKIVKDPRGPTLGRGTEISLFLKEDASEYLDLARLRELITKHAEYNSAPVFLYSSNSLSPAPEAPVEAVEEDGEVKVEDESEEVQAEKEEPVWEQINDRPPLWMRDPKQVTKEEYDVRLHSSASPSPSIASLILYCNHRTSTSRPSALLTLPPPFRTSREMSEEPPSIRSFSCPVPSRTTSIRRRTRSSSR
jgi:heat shock protein beta